MRISTTLMSSSAAIIRAVPPRLTMILAPSESARRAAATPSWSRPARRRSASSSVRAPSGPGRELAVRRDQRYRGARRHGGCLLGVAYLYDGDDPHHSFPRIHRRCRCEQPDNRHFRAVGACGTPYASREIQMNPTGVMTQKTLVVADDLTGAQDTAIRFRTAVPECRSRSL